MINSNYYGVVSIFQSYDFIDINCDVDKRKRCTQLVVESNTSESRADYQQPGTIGR